jgi:hypothetical protein
MNKTLFLTLTLAAASALSAVAAPAHAQKGLPASGYCTGESIQISGWQNDLVNRNKGLEKFHWSAINTVQHYNVVPTVVNQKNGPRALTPYHYSKPTVVSNWADPHAPVAIASSDNGSRGNVSGNLRRASNGTSTYAAMRGYDANQSYQQAGYNTQANGQVSGRVMHY